MLEVKPRRTEKSGNALSKSFSIAPTETEAAEETSQEETVDEEENYDTGDASLDNIRNQDEIGEQELLVLSFGTSYNDSRRLTVVSSATVVSAAVVVSAVELLELSLLLEHPDNIAAVIAKESIKIVTFFIIYSPSK